MIRGIDPTSVAAAFGLTCLLLWLLQPVAKRLDLLDHPKGRKDHAQHPAGRVGRPEDIAEVVAWLLDGQRSGFVSGANFTVDGGMTKKMIYEE